HESVLRCNHRFHRDKGIVAMAKTARNFFDNVKTAPEPPKSKGKKELRVVEVPGMASVCAFTAVRDAMDSVLDTVRSAVDVLLKQEFTIQGCLKRGRPE